MGFKCGIVGLPNVGKSTLFNALTQSNKAEAANYPFATIEPNIGRVAVPDDRLDKLAIIGTSEKIIPSFMDFVDIAGLVKGASQGEGLGNKFLGHVREVDAIAHVVRCFEDTNITHVSSKIDPLDDIETINLELQLADLESLNNKKSSLEKKLKANDKEAKHQFEIINKILQMLDANRVLNINEFDRVCPIKWAPMKPALKLSPAPVASKTSSNLIKSLSFNDLHSPQTISGGFLQCNAKLVFTKKLLLKIFYVAMQNLSLPKNYF